VTKVTVPREKGKIERGASEIDVVVPKLYLGMPTRQALLA
jgi:deoxyribose-phosphate aldolase